MAFNHRQNLLVELVQEHGFITMDEMVKYFNVTPQTIRRDLNSLAESELIIRHHGGAEARTSTTNTSYQSRKILHLGAKERIAKSLVKLIPNGASVFINIGTTTETVARALLHHKNLYVVTNNIHVAAILSPKEDFTVIVAAGEVRHQGGGIIGEATCDFIRQFNLDFGIIGISGISLDGGLLDFDLREVRVAQAIIENSQTVFLAADHSKFGRNAMIKQADISQVAHLFTDAMPPAEMANVLASHELEVHLVEKP